MVVWSGMARSSRSKRWSRSPFGLGQHQRASRRSSRSEIKLSCVLNNTGYRGPKCFGPPWRMFDHPLASLIRRLRSVAGLSDSSQSILSTLPHRVVDLAAGHDLYEAGCTAPPCYVLVDGCASRFKLRSDGTRAIVAFELSGDIINPEGFLLGRVDCGARISIPSTVAIIDQDVIERAREADRNLESTLWRYAFVKAAALEEWLLNVGRRSPTGRLAHLFLELHLRLIAIGASKDYASKLHVSSEELADAMGLQLIIVTRCLHELASQNGIVMKGDVIVLLDVAQLVKIGDFRSDYLHLAA